MQTVEAKYVKPNFLYISGFMLVHLYSIIARIIFFCLSVLYHVIGFYSLNLTVSWLDGLVPEQDNRYEKFKIINRQC